MNMKMIFTLAALMLTATAVSAFAHAIIVGHEYAFEWSITNDRTGEVIDPGGRETIVPQSGWRLMGLRSMEAYTRNNRFGWSAWTRVVDGVRRRLNIRMLDPCPETGHVD
ncbi:MAG: hypothetical protein FWD88_02735 [Treponema sp.]|nr:hypothetical protein [Treponema sp.]